MAIINSLGGQELSYLSSLSASQGYQVLNKSIAQSVTNFEKTPQAQSDITYFEQNIGKEKTVSQFLGNTRLVDFVLSAYGLDAEQNYQGLIKQVLTQDPTSSKSLVNQLSDPKFKQLATALDFFHDGLGQLQAVGIGAPTGATVAEGVTLSTKTTATISAPTQPAIVTTQSVNANIPLKIGATTSGNQYFRVQEPAGSSNTIGIGFSDNEYLQVQEPDGTTGYAQSGSFTLNSSNQLALADGSVLQPATTFPTGTTSVNVTSGGQLQAYVNGSTTATVVGQLQTATFTDATQLGQDANGYYTPTGGSGTATVAASTGTVSAAGTVAYTQSGYFTVNSSGQLAASDGSILYPNIAVPSDTTSVNITSDGVIEANELGSKTPTVLAQLQTASFADPSSLTQDSLGHYTANSASGPATVGDPTSAISTYGITSNLQTTVTQTTAATTSGAGISVGLGVDGSDYLVLQKSDGTQTYAKSGYFTINSNNQLALPDGTQLVPSPTLPSGATGVTVTSSGALYAQVKGQSKPTSIGQLETAKFANPSQLSKDKNGYYVPTAASGPARVGFQSGNSFAFNNTIQNLVNNYVQNEFEIAVGTQNTGVREALYFQRTISSDEAAYKTYNLATKADVILGDSVLANVAETILGQPAQIAYQSLTSQEHIIQTGIQINQLQNTKYVASLTARYLGLYDVSNAGATQASSSPALQILSAFSGGGSSSSSSSSSGGSSLLSLIT